MGITIRPIEPSDIAAAVEIWDEVVREGRAFPQTEELSQDDASVFFGEQSRTAVAADDGGEVVGLYILHPNNIGRCSGVANASYAVRSDMRGHGIGRALVCDSIVSAGQLGFTGLQFNAVVESNAAARHLYEDLGFDRIGVIPRGFLNGEGELEDMHIYYHPCNSPGELPMLDVAEVVEMEKRIEVSGTSLYELMSRAGKAIAGAAIARLGKQGLNPEDGQVLILAGTGNNGGDGWVAARLLAEAGAEVALVTPRAADEIEAQPAATAASETMREAESEDAFQGSLSVHANPDLQVVENLVSQSDIVIDAMLGTGFSHDVVREPLASWISIVNAQKAMRSASSFDVYVIVADAPSGLNAQTGEAANPCVRADETVTMLAYKKGLLAPGAVPYVGRIILADLKPWEI